MSVQSAPYYWLTCDGCGVKSTEDSEFSAWADEGSAEEEAMNSDWLVEPDRHLCEKCSSSLRCSECGEVFPKGATTCPDRECAADSDDPPYEGLGTV